jgi:hypothetical protein
MLKLVAVLVAAFFAYSTLSNIFNRNSTPPIQVIEVTQASHEKLAREHAEKEAERERKSVDPAILKKVAAIKDNQFCAAYGKAMRAKDKNGNTPYSIAMLERAINEFGVKAGFIDAVSSRHIALGMSQCEVIAAWGRPERANRSVGSFGEHYQLVYGDGYVYTENGTVTSWQD